MGQPAFEFPMQRQTMKTKICLLGICAFVTLVVAAPRTWVLKTGETVTGDYVSSGTTTLVVKTGGTNCFLKIADLATNDQAYIAKIKADQKQAQLDAEAAQMRAAGKMKFTVQLFENFPEKVVGHYGWIDAYFKGLTIVMLSPKRTNWVLELETKTATPI